MKHFSLSIILNSIVFFFTLSIIFVLILRFYFSLSLSLLYSTLLGILLTFLYTNISLKKINHKKEKKEIEKEIESTFIELCFMKKSEVVSLIYRAKKEENISVQRTTKYLKILDENCYIFPFFSFDEPTKNEIVEIFNLLKKDEKAIIYTYKDSKENEKFINSLKEKIELKDKIEIYNLLKKTNLLPQKTHYFEQERYIKKISIKNFFERKKAKKFFSLGLALSFSSLFVRYKIYYLIFGIAFLLCFLICFCFGKKEIKN